MPPFREILSDLLLLCFQPPLVKSLFVPAHKHETSVLKERVCVETKFQMMPMVWYLHVRKQFLILQDYKFEGYFNLLISSGQLQCLIRVYDSTTDT